MIRLGPHARVEAEDEQVVVRSLGQEAGCGIRLTQSPALGAATGRRCRGLFFIFHGGKFPPGSNRGAKKSPSGMTPEGLKSCERSEPSRRVRGGYDRDDNGGNAIRDCEGRFDRVDHVRALKDQLVLTCPELSGPPEFCPNQLPEKRPK